MYVYIHIYIYMVQCWPAPPLPPTQWCPTVASIRDCHFVAARPACLTGQADPPPPRWFGGFAFFHDCQVIQIFHPLPPPVVWWVCLLTKLSSLSLAENIQTSSLPQKRGWLSSFNNCHHSCQVIQIFPLPPVVWVVGGHAPSPRWLVFLAGIMTIRGS